jgi:hypothetical protein
MKLKNPEIRSRVSSMCFSDERFYPGLQAADMIAHCSREILIANMDGTPPPEAIDGLYEILTLRGRPKLFDRPTLDEGIRVHKD